MNWRLQHILNGRGQKHPTVALVAWGNEIEDYLATVDVTLETFCTEFTGSWLFGYIDALTRANVRTVLILISGSVRVPTRFVHRPTQANVWVLPSTRLYRRLRRTIHNPYGRTVAQVFGATRGLRRLLWPFLAVLRELVLYLPTPPLALLRILRRERCTIMLCQEYEYPRFDVCVLLGRLFRVPVFASFQGGDYQRSRVERFLRPLSMRACTGLLIAAATEIHRVQTRYQVPSQKISTIVNPIDLSAWTITERATARLELAIPVEAQVVAWHGRVSIHKKGLDILLDAWQQVLAAHPGQDLRLLLVGTGHDAEELEQQIAAIHIQGIIWVDEFVHDRRVISTYLSAADLYVFPSRLEGFPVAPIEAMACGLPIVASAASGVPEIVGSEAEGAGLIVPVDDATALAEAMNRMLDDTTLRARLAGRARARAEQGFGLAAVGQRLRNFLTSQPESQE